MIEDADLIGAVKNLRRLVSYLDSIGFPVKELANDHELIRLIPKDLQKQLISTSGSIHAMLQNIEKSDRYKQAVKNLCFVKVSD